MKTWQRRTSSSEMDSDMSGRQKQPVELLKAVMVFGTLFMIAEGDLPVLLLKKEPDLLPYGIPLHPLCASTDGGFHPGVLLWFSSCVASSKEGPVLSLQLPLLLASSFCEAVPLASLVCETTALQFKLQVAVYLDHNYPQHFHYKTLGLVL